MADELTLAEKIALKAARALEPLRVEMAMNKWPAEFRKILWEAVSDTARALAQEYSEEPIATRPQPQEREK